MNRPIWATVVGVLGIIFGCFGILGSFMGIAVPYISDHNLEWFEKMQEIAKDNPSINMNENSFELMREGFKIPSWYDTWALILSIIKVLVSALYLYASISLLQVKPSAIKLFYSAMMVSIGYGLINCIAGLNLPFYLATFVLLGNLFSIAIDAVLLIIVKTSNKEAFTAA